MKFAVVALLLALNSVSALPSGISGRYDNDPRNNAVEALIIEQLESLRKTILEGSSTLPVLDPLQQEDLHINLTDLGVGGHLNIHKLVLSHLSTFAADEVSFSYLTRRLDFQLSIPVLELVAENYELSVNVNGYIGEGSGPATIRVHGGRVVGWARIVPSIIGGASLQIQDCHLTLHIGQFEPQIDGLLGEGPESDFVNNVLGHLVPDLVEYFQDDISGFLNEIFEQVLNDILQDL